MGTGVNSLSIPCFLGDSKFCHIALNNKQAIHKSMSKSINHKTTKPMIYLSEYYAWPINFPHFPFHFVSNKNLNVWPKLTNIDNTTHICVVKIHNQQALTCKHRLIPLFFSTSSFLKSKLKLTNKQLLNPV